MGSNIFYFWTKLRSTSTLGLCGSYLYGFEINVHRFLEIFQIFVGCLLWCHQVHHYFIEKVLIWTSSCNDRLSLRQISWLNYLQIFSSEGKRGSPRQSLEIKDRIVKAVKNTQWRIRSTTKIQKAWKRVWKKKFLWE